jgi:serine/threonine-protein kinase
VKRPRGRFQEIHGPKLGRYQPLASLDEGGMATVVLALGRGPARVKKLVVIKSIRPELAHDGEYVAMFLEEARLASRLNHHNVIDIYEVGLDDGDPPRPFIVMEYLEGQSLQALIARLTRAKMPLPIHLRVLVDALAGLDHAHQLKDFDGTPLQIVHRDVSPENVFVGYEGLVKLLDFGIAKAVGSASRTERGKFKGKLGYVAPEQIEGAAVDCRADIFSVGVMLWEALAGRRLTLGLTQQAVARARLAGKHPPVLEARPDAHPGLAAVCERAMSLRPADRFPTAAAFAAAIEEQMTALRWRVSERHVAGLANEAFAAERARIRSTIEQRILALSDSSTTLRPEPLPGHFVARSTLPPAAPSGDEEPTRKHSTAPPSPEQPEQPEHTDTVVDATVYPRRRWLPALVGVCALAALIALAWSLQRSARQAAPALSAPPAASAGEAPAVVASSVPELVRLDIAASPSTAVLELDGQPLGANPFRGDVPRAAGEHRITASAPGHATQQRLISLERDVVLSLSLEKLPGSAASWSSSQPDAAADGPVRTDKRAIDGTDPYGP